MNRSVILDNLRSAWNVGSVFRTAAALNYQEVVLCGVTIQPPSQKLRETSRGTEDLIKWTGFATTLAGIEHKRKQGFRIVAVEAMEESISIEKWRAPLDVAYVMGNEAKGLSEEVLKACDEVVSLPMPGGSVSINVSCAFAAMAYIDGYGNQPSERT